MSQEAHSGSGSGAIQSSARHAIVDADALRGFPEMVRELGGDPEALLRAARIDPAVFDGRGAVLEYRRMLKLLADAAVTLDCPDFGMRLAATHGGNNALGPIGVVMRNSKTLGQAIGYCARNAHAYSLATRVRFEPDRANRRLLVKLEILLEQLLDKRQAVEHGLMLAAVNISELTGGAARVRKVLLSHAPQSSAGTYRERFGSEVAFEDRVDGIVLTEDDLMTPVIDPDARVYDMATAFIEARFPKAEPSLRAQVAGLVLRHLGTTNCTSERIAAELCLHPRTMQRRLRAEGGSFEEIKDEARRAAALRFIRQVDMPLAQVAERLGYAETSVLSRSCHRWFSTSPRRLRMQSHAEAAHLQTA